MSGRQQSFLMEEGVLMRTWVAKPASGKLKTSEDWNTVHQIVLPVVCRRHVWDLGIAKTSDRILQNYFCPSLKTDVVHFCRTSTTYQIVGKPVPPWLNNIECPLVACFHQRVRVGSVCKGAAWLVFPTPKVGRVRTELYSSHSTPPLGYLNV